jgi:hypothetical protein
MVRLQTVMVLDLVISGNDRNGHYCFHQEKLERFSLQSHAIRKGAHPSETRSNVEVGTMGSRIKPIKPFK